MSADQWSKDVAVLAADALVDAKLVQSSSLAKAAEIIAEEIWIRLQAGDYPPKTSR